MVAKTRLMKLVRRLSKDRTLLEEYGNVIRSSVANGYAEQVPNNGGGCPERIYYMPHREVIRETSTTTRLRVMFDVSSHDVGCTSVNDQLETGPKLHPDLLDIVIRFRMNTVILVADIQKAFLQIGINEADLDAHRFMWFQEPPLQPSMN